MVDPPNKYNLRVGKCKRETFINVHIENTEKVLVLEIGHRFNQMYNAHKDELVIFLRMIILHQYIKQGIEYVLQELHHLLSRHCGQGV